MSFLSTCGDELGRKGGFGSRMILEFVKKVFGELRKKNVKGKSIEIEFKFDFRTFKTFKTYNFACN